MKKPTRKTELELLAELKNATGKKRGLTELSERYGFTIQFISDVVYGRRAISERLAEAMGYRRVVEYEKM